MICKFEEKVGIEKCSRQFLLTVVMEMTKYTDAASIITILCGIVCKFEKEEVIL